MRVFPHVLSMYVVSGIFVDLQVLKITDDQLQVIYLIYIILKKSSDKTNDQFPTDCFFFWNVPMFGRDQAPCKSTGRGMA